MTCTTDIGMIQGLINVYYDDIYYGQQLDAKMVCSLRPDIDIPRVSQTTCGCLCVCQCAVC